MDRSEPFSVRIAVRSYEIDPQLHVNGAVYIQYADHSSYACVKAAGVDLDDFRADGVGPVNLETVIRYHQELREGDEVDVTCQWRWGEGRTYRVEHAFRRPDGVLVAEVNSVSAVLDLRTRKLIGDPAQRWREHAAEPALLGLG